MSEHSKTVYDAAAQSHDIDAGRRALMTGVAGGALGALFGLAPTPAEAASGIGFVGTAQAQPAAATTPVGAAWWPSRWGADDQAGASNWITPEKALDAFRLVRSGKIYEMGRIYESTMPKFGERAFTLRIPGGPTGGPLGTNRVIWHDEYLATEIGQVGTQMDGLGHIGVAVKGEDRAEMRFYNGLTAAEISNAYGLKKLGVEHIKPILTRGLLLDIVAIKGRNMNLGEEITVADIEAALRRQNLGADALKAGDAIFFNTGWGSLWNKDNVEFGKGAPGVGLAAGQWCIEKQVCLVGADTWCVEVVPNPNSNLAFPVHQEFLTKNGIFIHENLDLAGLAADSVSQFLYVMTPIRIKGGTGSPGRPIAIV
jgi:kynurenine formamidase